MGNIVADRLKALRASMKEAGADWYFCTSDDFHGSEFVADYFKVREHYTGFTGENAFLLLNDTNSYMWTDGRFFIQADIELKGSGVALMKMGEPDVPAIPDFLKAALKEGEKLFFDGRMVSTAWGKKLLSICRENKAELVYDKDLAGDLWQDRPSLPSSKIDIYGEEVTGESTASKLKRIREAMKGRACANFIGSIDDIAWITNMRGRDVECNPVFLSYMLITEDKAYLFMQDSEVSAEVEAYLLENSIELKAYGDVLSFLEGFKYDGSVLLDEASVNFACYRTISEKAAVLNDINPSKLMKAVKNKTEIERLKGAYLRDSVCVTKFCYWLKQTVGKEKLTELSAAAKMDSLRAEVADYI